MLSKFSVKRPYTIVVAVITVLILGVVSFINMDTDLLPSIDLPYIVIMTNYPGASPEEVELVVTRPIEQAVATVSNVKNISSISRENSSIVILEFNSDTNMDSATIEINGMLDMIKPAWDNYSISSPMLMRLNPDMLPIMISAVDIKDMDLVEVSQLVRDEIIPELESVNGVASVNGIGLLEEEILIRIDDEKVETLNKRILEKVDGELLDAEEELTKAKKEIEDGKTQLASEEERQLERLSEGEKAIALGKEQLALAESQISQAKTELTSRWEELNNSLREINEQEEKLKEGERALLALGDKIGQEDKLKLDEIRKNLGLISQSKKEIEAGLNTISTKLEELKEEENNIKAKRTELISQEQELRTGKIQLTMEMDKARAKLESGEKELEKAMEEFEKARDEAFKKASLDGVITSDMISGLLRAQNFSMPAGYVTDDGGVKTLVKVGEKIEDISQLEDLLLFDTGEEVIGKIYLKDVAQVSIEDNSEAMYAKVNGSNAVMLVMQKQSNFLTSNVSKSIKEKAEELEAKYEGLSFTPLMDQGIYIDMVIDSVLKNIIYGGILAIVVLIIFLRDIKPTFVIATSIPISIIFAVALMYFTGVTINVISLAGLALGVGMLVDNSIVVIENIYRLRNEGMEPKEAAIKGANEIAGAITASTLTTICVFLPIVFVQGISRQLFTDMGLTIAYSLLASLLVALTLVPTMASTTLRKVTVRERTGFEKLLNLYERMLRVSLNHRGMLLALVGLLFLFSLYGGYRAGTAFMPDVDAPQMSMTLEMPKGSTPKETEKMADIVVERLLNIEEIETIGAFSGGLMESFGGFEGGESISFYLLLDEDKDIRNEEIKNRILDLTADLDCTISVDSSNMDISALAGSGIEVVIKGKEMDTLHQIALDMKKLLEDTEGVSQVELGLDEDLKEIRIQVDKEKAMEKGLTVAQVFSHINSIIGSKNSTTNISIENKDYPVIVLNKEDEDFTQDELEDISIKGNKEGEEVEVLLKDIASIKEAQGLSSIRRDAQERFISLTAELDSDYNIEHVSRDFERRLEDYSIPAGYRVEIAGERELINESLEDLFKMLLLAIALIYLIMVAQFQSLLSPFIILFTIPLAFTGGLLALVITGHEISVIAMIGFLVLSGVVVNNGIVFIDYTNQLREQGLNKTEALVLAGRTRMRPILMTAITTIFGLSTLSAGLGSGAEMLQPLAIVSIGGLIYATVLTLFAVPTMYHLLNRDN